MRAMGNGAFYSHMPCNVCVVFLFFVGVAMTGSQNEKTKKKPNKRSVGCKYFDDCLICQAMEKADKQGRNLSERELTNVFKLANEHQKRNGN